MNLKKCAKLYYGLMIFVLFQSMQASSFEKLKNTLPLFMDEVGKSNVFQSFDCNLKFNKTEIDITILRDKAKSLGVSVQDITQTLQLAFSGNRFSYFVMNDKQYQNYQSIIYSC